jgi:hypothetical protein
MSDSIETVAGPPDTVYLAVKDGRVLVHTDLQAMKEMDGVSTPDLAVPLKEFYRAGGNARLIDGRIVLGRTEDEKRREAEALRIVAIDKRLAALDAKSIRPGRAVSLAAAKGEAPDPADVVKLDAYEAEIAALRAEREGLEKPVS